MSLVLGTCDMLVETGPFFVGPTVCLSEECKCGRPWTLMIAAKKDSSSPNDVFFCWACTKKDAETANARIAALEGEIASLRRVMEPLLKREYRAQETEERLARCR